jgi:hypothetical protein
MQAILILVVIATASAFRGLPVRSRSVSTKVNVFPFSSLLTAAQEITSKGDDYVYGAVSAPEWALPLGAVLVIATAAIPLLLRPGEEALEQQRENEKTTNSQFNKRKNKDLL